MPPRLKFFVAVLRLELFFEDTCAASSLPTVDLLPKKENAFKRARPNYLLQTCHTHKVLSSCSYRTTSDHAGKHFRTVNEVTNLLFFMSYLMLPILNQDLVGFFNIYASFAHFCCSTTGCHNTVLYLQIC